MPYDGLDQHISPDAPVGEQAPSPQAGAPQQPNPNQPPPMDAEQKREALQRTINDLSRMRYFRRQYDQRRAYFYRQYVFQRDQRYYPDNITPRSNTFVPYIFSNVETVVSRVMDAFFSQDPAFETRGRTPNDEPAAEQMQAVLGYTLKRANLVDCFEQLVRNLSIYGFAGIKVDWDWRWDVVNGKEPQFQMQPQIDPQTGQPARNPQTGEALPPQPVQGPDGQPVIIGWNPVTHKVPRACPKLTPIDVYDLLVDPDKRVVAHLTEKTYYTLQREQQEYRQANQTDLYFPEGLAQLGQKLSGMKNPDAVIVRIAEVWDEDLNTWTVTTYGEDSEAISWKDLRASFRAATYSPYKRTVYAGEPIMLWHGPNPFMHKRNPILFTSYIKLPNELFGLGMVEIISDLNEALNRFANMVTDNWDMGINRRYAYDINADIDHEALNSMNVPGGKVGVSGDPSKVLMPLPTHTPMQEDYLIMDLYKGMIEMASGVADFYSKGVGSPSGNRTATGIQQVIGETNFKFRMFIRNLEIDIMDPLLDLCASMIQQFLPDQIRQMIVEAPQAVPQVFPKSPEALFGNFSYDIVAANYASNKTIKQRNLMSLGQLLMQDPFINGHEATKELLKAFEIRNPKILKTEEQVAMEQQQALQQQIAMMTLESMLDLDSKQKQIETKAAVTPKKTGEGTHGKQEGRPSINRKVPGAGMSSSVRDFAQSIGANKMGLHGMGEVNHG